MRLVFVLLAAISIGLQVIGAEKNGSYRKEQHHVSDVADRVLDVVGPSPQTWNLKNLNTGGSATIKTCVKTPDEPDIEVLDIQVYLLSDTTSSMGEYLEAVIEAFSQLVSELLITIPTCYPWTVEIAVGEYRDEGDSFVYRLNQGFTTNYDDVLKALNNWSAEGGGGYEANLYALKKAAEEPWDSTKLNILYWVGDAAGNDPSVDGVTLLDAIDVLVAKNIMVIPIVAFGGLDDIGQATDIYAATNFLSSLSSDKTSTSSIATALDNIYIPSPNTSKSVDKTFDTNDAALAKSVKRNVSVFSDFFCSPGLNLTFSPSSVTGRAGDTLCMDEVLTMTGCVGEGFCVVDFFEKCSGSYLGSQEVSVTCCSEELVSFRLWTASDPTEPTEIAEGDEICLPNSRISIEANYGDCAGYRKNPIRSVRLAHTVNGRKQYENTERSSPYFLYGDRNGKITWRKPILGQNKINAKVNGDGPMKEINFKFKSCPY